MLVQEKLRRDPFGGQVFVLALVTGPPPYCPKPAALHSVLRSSVAWSCLEP
jgi:hypothetical protein